MEAPVPLWQINVFVDDLEASKHFYEGLGWRIEAMGPLVGVAHLPGELSVALLPAAEGEFVAAFDSGHPGTTGGSAPSTCEPKSTWISTGSSRSVVVRRARHPSTPSGDRAPRS